MAADTYDVADGGATKLQELRNTLGIWSKKYKLQDLLTLAGAGTVAEVNDVFQLLDLPARTFVLMGGIIPHVADGDTLTADLGDGGNIDGFVDGADLNSTTALSTVIADPYGGDTARGNLYASADTLDIKILTIGSQTSHLAEFTVWAIMGQIPNAY